MTVLVAFLLPAIIGCKKDETIVTPVNTDKVKLGQTVDAGSSVITSSGGTITVARPGTPVDGMTITVPAHAYSDARTFSISYAPIESHTFGSDFNPISPLITITNGGGYADSSFVIRIPAHISAGEFAMAFSYDATTGQLEGLPILSCDSAGVTLLTRQVAFNALAPRAPLGKSGADVPWLQVVLSKIEDRLLQGQITSDFTPGNDDWEFTNWGAYPSVGGICSGMTFTAMYYYDMIKPYEHVNLYERYDSVHGKDMWMDNPLGIKFAAMNQVDMTQQVNGWRQFQAQFVQFANTWYDQYRAFAYSIKLTHQPQYVYICGPDGAHAMVVYATNNNVMSVSDPNLPANKQRIIEYSPALKYFKPYYTGLTAGDAGYWFTQMYYIARAAVVSWNTVGQRWQEFRSGTIGSGGCFPAYTLWVRDGSGYELVDGLNTDNDTLPVQVKCPTCPDQSPDSLYIEVFDGSGSKIATSGAANTAVISLVSGKNRFGICVYAKATHSCNGAALKANAVGWVDFKWFNVTRAGMTIESETPGGAPFIGKGRMDTTYLLRASMSDRGPLDRLYTWSFGDGSSDAQVRTDSTVQHRFLRAGACTVKVKLSDNATGTPVAEATAVATIAGAPAISSITPDTLSWGSTAEIRGTGFGATQGTSYIDFSGAKTAAIEVWSDSLIRFVVPDSASGGWLQVVINGTHSNLVRYWVRRPTIDRVDPTHGKAGTVVRLIGRGFGPTQRNSLVKFSSPNDTVIPATFWSDTLIITAIPTTVQYYGGFKAYFTVYQKGTVNSNSGAIYIDRDWYRTAQRCTTQTSSWTSKNIYTTGGVTGCISTSIQSFFSKNHYLVWSDSSFALDFTETSAGSTVTVSVHGTISGTGEMLKTLRGTYESRNGDGTSVIRKAMSFTNVPLDTSTSHSSWMEFKITGPAAQSHASQLQDDFKNGINLDYTLASTIWDDPQCTAEVRLVIQ